MVSEKKVEERSFEDNKNEVRDAKDERFSLSVKRVRTIRTGVKAGFWGW
jgi:hypothetical protein